MLRSITLVLGFVLLIILPNILAETTPAPDSRLSEQCQQNPKIRRHVGRLVDEVGLILFMLFLIAWPRVELIFVHHSVNLYLCPLLKDYSSLSNCCYDWISVMRYTKPQNQLPLCDAISVMAFIFFRQISIRIKLSMWKIVWIYATVQRQKLCGKTRKTCSKIWKISRENFEN